MNSNLIPGDLVQITSKYFNIFVFKSLHKVSNKPSIASVNNSRECSDRKLLIIAAFDGFLFIITKDHIGWASIARIKSFI